MGSTPARVTKNPLKQNVLRKQKFCFMFLRNTRELILKNNNSRPGHHFYYGEVMSKAEKVVRFYSLCNRLKDVVRSGWKVWNVERERLESVAEHVYGTQMLAIAMWSEYGYELDLA